MRDHSQWWWQHDLQRRLCDVRERSTRSKSTSILRRYFTPSLLMIFRHPSGRINAISSWHTYDSHTTINLNIFMYKFLVSRSLIVE